MLVLRQEATSHSVRGGEHVKFRETVVLKRMAAGHVEFRKYFATDWLKSPPYIIKAFLEKTARDTCLKNSSKQVAMFQDCAKGQVPMQLNFY